MVIENTPCGFGLTRIRRQRQPEQRRPNRRRELDALGGSLGTVEWQISNSFDVGSAALMSPAVGSTTAQWTQLQGAAPAGTTGVTYRWRRADTWANIPTGDVNLSVGGGPVTWPVAPSGGTYPSLNWNLRQTLSNANTPAGMTGRWLLNENSGTTAADASGLGNPGTCVSVTWSGAHGGSAVRNGTTSQITTAHTVVNTAASFSVSAWVNLGSSAANEIAVSENSTQQSGFDLRYQKSTNKWVFGRWNADIANAPTFITASTPFTALNTWTHLVGTFNASTGSDDRLRQRRGIHQHQHRQHPVRRDRRNGHRPR